MRQIELYKYNPGQCSAEEMLATFVAREAVLAGILDDLRARARSRVNQHFLITGPRGIGKSNLLLMVRHRVADDEALAAAYLPIQTAEEEYSIASLRDLFAKILSLLLEADTDEELAGAAESVDSADDDDEAVETALAALKGYRKRTKQKLLLLVDNLDLILGNQLTDDAQIGKLRDVLMNESFLVLVSASPTHFKEVSGYDRPFYNFFKPIDLEDLPVEQMADLLRRRAEWDENTGLLDRLGELRPRLRAVHHLTGGNPRLALMLYQACTQTELPEVRTALRMLLDDLTPYFKSRLEGLSPQQRKVMDTFARLGRPATPTELAGETRLPVNQINSILKRLRELGFVAVPPQERRKATLYMVSERVFRIWHQMRFSTAGRRKLEFLVEFIRIWYSAEEWEEEADRLLTEYKRFADERRFAQAGRFVEHLDYLAEAAPTDESRYRVADETVQACITSGDFTRAQGVLESRIREETQARDHARLAHSYYLKASLCYAQHMREAEILALREAVQLQPGFALAQLCLGDALRHRGSGSVGIERRHALEEACTTYRSAVDADPALHGALNNWGVTLMDLAQMHTGKQRESLMQEAIQKYDAVLRVKPDDDNALNNWGSALYRLAVNKVGKDAQRLLDEACAKFEAALCTEPDKYEALGNWGTALHHMAVLSARAERELLLRRAYEKYEAAIKLAPDTHEILANMANALSLLAPHLDPPEEERAFRTARQRIGEAVRIAESRGAMDLLPLYSANHVRIALRAASCAAKSENVGQIRALFSDVLHQIGKAEPRDAHEAVAGFFSYIASAQHATLCAELLEQIRARGLNQERDLLAPFACAVRYWQKGNDPEVLDRLNPEVREIVEKIVSGEHPEHLTELLTRSRENT